MSSQWKLDPYVEESDRATTGGEEDCTGADDEMEASEDGTQ